MNQIDIVALSKYYGDFCALDDASIQVSPGEFLTLLGPSGSGKSTLLMALAGFVPPSGGDLLVDGTSILNLPPEKRDFGVVFQGYALFPHMSVARNLAYPLKARQKPASEIEERVKQVLELVHLGHLADRHPKQLSGGQQQRVALARALVFSPKVLLLDEPMGALDKKLRYDLQAELRTLHRQTGRTFINVTHDQEEAMSMSDRIAVMNHGRIVQIAEPRVLYERPRTRFVADFLGKSNFIEGKVSGIAGGIASVDTPEGRVLHRLRDETPQVGDSVTLALRPEKLRQGGGENTLRAKVETATFLGTHAELTVRTASGQEMFCHCSVEHEIDLPAEGNDIGLGWSPVATAMIAPD